MRKIRNALVESGVFLKGEITLETINYFELDA
jgi:hypothetical protein